MIKRRYQKPKNLTPDIGNNRHKTTPQPRIDLLSYKRKKKNTQPIDTTSNDSLTNKGNLAELNKLASELIRRIPQSPVSFKYNNSMVFKRSSNYKRKMSKSERLALKTYSQEVKKQHYKAKLPIIQNQQKLESVQKFYLEFHHKSKQLLSQLKERLLENLSLIHI